MSYRPPSALTTLTTALGTIVLYAGAFTARAENLDDTLVTAQKRTQHEQDVGIALTVLSGEQLGALGKSDSVQIAALIPGVSISGSSGNQSAQFSIRGVTQNDFSDHVEAPNAVYIDEGYVGFSQGQMFGLFDLDHVEILKGPQGTLFGRNTEGGALSIVSKAPSGEFGGRMQFALYHTVTFRDDILVRQGGPRVDLLDGGATGLNGGTPRQQLEAQAGASRNGLGAWLTAEWRSASSIYRKAATCCSPSTPPTSSSPLPTGSRWRPPPC
ncbi:MAG: TonB-dependent receptor plug domain-containing protein [Proteobacteria bacterium]|nr:TonB-dependent receptor plug domain-containing protein [Pseudomonadota bacterium]